MQIKVWGMSSSGNCHKVKLILDYLKIPYQWIETDTRHKATQTEEFRKMNANARVPLVQLEDGTYLPESNAILYYFAQGTAFWPQDKLSQTRVLQWMFFEQYDHEPRLAVNRAIQSIFNTIAERRAEYDANFPKGYKALSVMENHLRATAEAGQGKPWFGAASASIADIALYAYTHVADQGGFSLADYPHIRAWLGEMERLPGHSRMTAS
ncbi:MAG: glutathione S-transferase N-terminal domain-containing protein [Turneriella sp.]|nr:glutathione S-transferase N-terminal domain-containing protein [Turneriella sp.]